jgi:hypothetical protein
MIPNLFFKLGERITTLMTGSPPLYANRRIRVANSTGIFINQAEVMVPDISARSSRGDQQVMTLVQTLLL